jgi:subtilase family serine protease
LELLALRGEIDDLDLSEGRLKLQVLQLQIQIANSERPTSGPANAPAADAASLANASQERLAALQAQLADAQERLARLSAQKEALTERKQAAQSRLNSLRANFQSGPIEAGARSRHEKTSSARRQRGHRPLIVLLCGLLLIALLGSLIRIVHLSSLGLSLLSPSNHTRKAGLPEQPPFFTPAQTAPTNQGCLTTIKAACYSPEYIQQAFGLTQLYKDGFDGRGQTIVLIGAGNTTTLEADLRQFNLAWGLPNLQLNIIYPDGPPAPYTCLNGDSLQYMNTLNVEWAHAIAPAAKIVLLIGSNKGGPKPQDNCVQASVQDDIAYALDHSLGNIISVNAGGSELGNISDTATEKASEQKYFAAGHQLLQRAAKARVTVLAATGDSGATNPNGYPKFAAYWLNPNVSWPASDPDALAVGGTVLKLGNDDAEDAYVGETAWGSAGAGATGGGLSAIFAEPDYQRSVPNQDIFQGKRGIPDVTFPATNLLIYASSYYGALIQANPQWKHWDLANSTSAAAACWAGLIAIANQMSQEPLGFIQPALYDLQGKNMRDITSGDNSYANVQGYQALKGYDLVTGWGTPIANVFLPALIKASGNAALDCTIHLSNPSQPARC